MIVLMRVLLSGLGETKHDTYGNLEPCIITYVQIDDLSSANTQGIEDW